MFFDMQKYIYYKSVFNTLYIEIKYKCLKNLKFKINGTKNALFLICELQLIIILLLICDFYMS